VWAVNQIDKQRHAFLWSGLETTTGGKCKVAWTMVCRPTCLGGLGVLDLRFFGLALRLRWEWLSRTAADSCWARLLAKEKVVVAMANVSMSVSLGNGSSTRLWTGSWAAVGPLCHFAPNLFAAVTSEGG